MIADTREMPMVRENRLFIGDTRAAADTRLRQGYAGQAVPPLRVVSEIGMMTKR